jgi:hypothetical protein
MPRTARVRIRRLPEVVRAGPVDAVSARSVELLYFEGCPHYEAMVDRLDVLMRRAGRQAQVQLRNIPDEPAAVRERFLGSPTVRVDGYDVEPGASERSDFGMTCRLYSTDEGHRETPLDEWILDALVRPASGVVGGPPAVKEEPEGPP